MNLSGRKWTEGARVTPHIKWHEEKNWLNMHLGSIYTGTAWNETVIIEPWFSQLQENCWFFFFPVKRRFKVGFFFLFYSSRGILFSMKPSSATSFFFSRAQIPPKINAWKQPHQSETRDWTRAIHLKKKQKQNPSVIIMSMHVQNDSLENCPKARAHTKNDEHVLS